MLHRQWRLLFVSSHFNYLITGVNFRNLKLTIVNRPCHSLRESYIDSHDKAFFCRKILLNLKRKGTWRNILPEHVCCLNSRWTNFKHFHRVNRIFRNVNVVFIWSLFKTKYIICYRFYVVIHEIFQNFDIDLFNRIKLSHTKSYFGWSTVSPG